MLKIRLVSLCVSLAFVLSSVAAFAQKRNKRNSPPAHVEMRLPDFDDQWIHFGFLLGVNKTKFDLKPAGDLSEFDSVVSMKTTPSWGFNLGIVANLRLGQYFDLRFVPDLSFTQRQVDYTLFPSDTSIYPVVEIRQAESNFVELPLELKWKSARKGNYRMYMIGGAMFAIDMASRKKDKDKEGVKLLKIDRKEYGYTIGFGMDFYLQYIKFSPQIKMYSSMKNVLVRDGSELTRAISGLYTKTFMFSITFE